jgi:4-amino-4-deoxy-L-arabinose transferase-like glycosyltransferase
LAVLLAAGVVLRLAFMLAYRPAFVGYFDTAVYLDAAKGALFWDPLRPAGYAVFLRMVHAVDAHLTLTILVQHVLGIATAVLLYGTVRGIGAPRWLALVPAAAVLLVGDQVFLEHAVLSEPLYTFLTAAGVYAATRCLDANRGLLWAAVAGLALGMAATARLAGLPLVPLVALWVFVAPELAWRRRAAMAVIGAGAAAIVLGGYLVAAHEQTGYWSFARDGAYQFYGRAATFADCKKFDPPKGTEVLCETTPRSKRPSAQYYVFEGPATVHFGKPQEDAASRENVALVGDWARSAALAQPLDWLRASARDFARFVAPGSNKGPTPAPAMSDYVGYYLAIPGQIGPNLERATAYYSSSGHVAVRNGLYDTLRDYAAVVRIEGPPLGVLLVLALVVPFSCRGRERRGALLLMAMGIGMLIVPVVAVNYDGRLGVPSYGFLTAAAALGAWGLAQGIRRRRPPPPP